MSEIKRCQRCSLSVEETDNFCRHCGCNLKPGFGFLNSHTGIILLMFVIGPFALPLVWTSKRIGTPAKIIYTILMVIMGYYLVVACMQMYQLTFQMMQSMTMGF